MTNSTLTSNQKLFVIVDEFCGNIRYYDETDDDSIQWSDKLRLSMCYSSQSAANDALSEMEYKTYRNLKNGLERIPKLRSILSKYPKLGKFRESIKIIDVESGQL
jgi:hypothetical protein